MAQLPWGREAPCPHPPRARARQQAAALTCQRPTPSLYPPIHRRHHQLLLEALLPRQLLETITDASFVQTAHMVSGAALARRCGMPRIALPFLALHETKPMLACGVPTLSARPGWWLLQSKTNINKHKQQASHHDVNCYTYRFWPRIGACMCAASASASLSSCTICSTSWVPLYLNVPRYMGAPHVPHLLTFRPVQTLPLSSCCL